jgi:hypothetical protein
MRRRQLLFQTDVRAKPPRPEVRRRKRRLRRRLFWTGVIFALTLIWLTVQVLRAAGAVASAARRPFASQRRQARRLETTEGRI